MMIDPLFAKLDAELWDLESQLFHVAAVVFIISLLMLLWGRRR